MCTECGCGLPAKSRIDSGKNQSKKAAKAEGSQTFHEHIRPDGTKYIHAHQDDEEHEHIRPDGTKYIHSHSDEHSSAHEHEHAQHVYEHSSAHSHEHSHDDEHEHSHDDEHVHEHSHADEHVHVHEHIRPDGTKYIHSHEHGVDDSEVSEGNQTQIIEVHKSIMHKNDLQAQRVKGYLEALKVLSINIVSAPGSGKTSLLKRTIEELDGKRRCAVIVGDLETDNDAKRLRETGAAVVQISTGTLCHLDASMIYRALSEIDLKEVDILFIENVGNLVCPATFNLGEDLRVAVLSVTEGEDKPLKYPPLFRFSQAILLSKMDLAEVCEFDKAAALANIRAINPSASIHELSSKSKSGFPEWIDYLLRSTKQKRS